MHALVTEFFVCKDLLYYCVSVQELIYRHICLMIYEKTHQTNLMAPRDPIDAPLDPLGPPGPPSTASDP